MCCEQATNIGLIEIGCVCTLNARARACVCVCVCVRACVWSEIAAFEWIAHGFLLYFHLAGWEKGGRWPVVVATWKKKNTSIY